MDIILTADVPHLGNMGDEVKVANGYGRNYLIPQKLAVQASKSNRSHFEHVKSQVEKKSALLRMGAMSDNDKIDGINLTFTHRSGGEDKLFGSVTNRDICEAISSMCSVDVDRRLVMMNGPLKELGIYEVPVKLHSDIMPKVRVWVVKM
jgi:large subunit ribosomal protein L9